MRKFRSAFYTPGWSGTRDRVVVPRESSPLGCPASFLASLAPKGVLDRAARIGAPPGRCDGWANARQLLLGPSAGPRHSPLQRVWPAGCCPMCAIAGTGLGNKIETALRET